MYIKQCIKKIKQCIKTSIDNETSCRKIYKFSNNVNFLLILFYTKSNLSIYVYEY